MTPMRRPIALLALSLAVAPLAPTIEAQQTEIRRTPSRWNLFSVQQDLEVGRQSATVAERQLPLLNDAATNRYLNAIIQRLAAHAPGADYPYQIKAVNATEINAFALPGGPMYVNRGLLTAARSEAELAGVLAHEMSHVALRHGTEHASKAYLGQAGLSLLGGLLGDRGNTTSQLVNAVGGFGLNAVFLKFSRGDEYEADALGAEIMSKAGYDPNAMATFFTVLRREQGRDPSKLERFFSSHPAAADREARIRRLASSLGGAQRQEVVGGFATIRSRLGAVEVAAEEPGWVTSTGEVATTPRAPVAVNVPPPSAQFVRFTHSAGFFAIDHPANLRGSSSGLAVSLAPEGGVVQLENGQPVMVYGFIVNHYEPFEADDDRRNRSLQRSYTPFEDRTARRGFLEDATDDLIRHVMSANSYLTPQARSARSGVIDGSAAYSIVLSGRSPVTGQEERVTVYTRALPDDHVIYALCVMPTSHQRQAEPTCERMVNSMRVDDRVVHRPGH